ncbi:hypothetical protein [Methylobacterium haplocladii]|nr:hypothetical protein [Methylobacterium haplocladii]GJD83860.1 hypothetical protein HPGCJGGD_1733 [Methylobacterium haplocladii]GLS60602.1 hypothetical protein GCM10007887_32840 [Methylobacterium haplocladii]
MGLIASAEALYGEVEKCRRRISRDLYDRQAGSGHGRDADWHDAYDDGPGD